MIPKITVYTKNKCMQCDFTKKWLKDHDVDFIEIDVTKDEEALNQLKMNGYQAVPVVAIGSLSYSWYGFRPDMLAKEFEK